MFAIGGSSQVLVFLFVRLATGCAFAHACWSLCGGFAMVLCYEALELGVQICRCWLAIPRLGANRHERPVNTAMVLPLMHMHFFSVPEDDLEDQNFKLCKVLP